MGEQTAIAWTDHTFNPWWGCERVSPGCHPGSPPVSAGADTGTPPSRTTWQTWLVVHLETWCDRLHAVTHHRPWLWLRSLPAGISSTCPLADLSERLDRRWRTGIWS